MTDKELRRLGRAELIDIIFELRKRCDEYEAENSSLKKELTQRELRISEAGSIAEAALRLNGVFEAAQAAADQYVVSTSAALWDARQQSDSILAAARKQAEEIVAEAERKARQIEGEKDQQDEE